MRWSRDSDETVGRKRIAGSIPETFANVSGPLRRIRRLSQTRATVAPDASASQRSDVCADQRRCCGPSLPGRDVAASGL